MRILVIGSGGREHALLHALHGNELTVAPGNAGMSRLAQVRPIDVSSPVDIVGLAREIDAELVVIGPEVPLVEGAADALIDAGIPVFGPTKAAAALEGSKAFAKEVMQAAGVKTASATRVESADGIEAALDEYGPRYVVKDDGLAGGKGVVVTEDRAEAKAHAEAVIESGNPVLFESFLEGPEVSLFCLVDGETVVPLLPAQDHKRAYDNDEGPNTGGMGAYAPLPWLPEDGVQVLVDDIARPVAEEMVNRGIPYQGLLYIGAAWGPEGPAVVEFNARFGDPETQAVLSLLETPLADVLLAVAEGRLDEIEPLKWHDGYAAMVVLAAEGYPQAAKTGGVITGETLDDPSQVLHAGTKEEDGEYVASGGRVLGVVGKGATLEEAVDNAYRIIEGIELPGAFYRKDIARPAIEGAISL
ncbi:phosphoribosylamine--glycine ligase [Corynebacterium lujinxingii]|uniref:Phosphoribosylamine--glycine ligase n=1 Tax=Corynebacterium lujinxingii TaxID=2763010 RepID=A0A7H0K281_9CORY|nr:phosphoribosylamine--glycine ligase [Corynebacterium lujinxingii]MBC3178384.1 phosphoribosylamine--glycine ligase [Corynebacterium lujinxingii]NNO10738.1 phosphoribosylamine--glycine ligase [Corynebacterium lujinxingii]QNP91397.1 phosphoribosylamine--glycine ligase [Corynebacterium lujinxingii]